MEKERLTCSKCGRSCDINYPCIDRDLNVYCYDCSKKYPDVFMCQVENWQVPGNITQSDHSIDYRYKGVHLSFLQLHDVWKSSFEFWRPVWHIMCWTSNGGVFWPIDDDEKANILSDPQAYMEMVAKTWESGVCRCSSCHRPILRTNIASRHFAGIYCVECTEENKKKDIEEARKGNVCRMCGKTYGTCCC